MHLVKGLSKSVEKLLLISIGLCSIVGPGLLLHSLILKSSVLKHQLVKAKESWQHFSHTADE